jgi:hypothetical protein
VTRREARQVLRDATGCSMARLRDLIPEPGASREVVAAMALQGILASGVSGDPHNKICAALDYADKLLAALAEEADA